MKKNSAYNFTVQVTGTYLCIISVNTGAGDRFISLRKNGSVVVGTHSGDYENVAFNGIAQFNQGDIITFSPNITGNLCLSMIQL